MSDRRFVIIGGVAAGMTAATKIRSLDAGAEILVFEKIGHVSYIACGMPYYIGGVVDSSKKLVVYDASYFKEKRNINVFLYHEVTKIVPDKKTVLVKDLATGTEKEYKYDKLLVATGARPFVPPIEGVSLEGVFTLRNLEQGIAFKEFVDTRTPEKGLILGAGSIGMEMAEAYVARGIRTTVIEKMPDILGTMDKEITEIIEAELKEHGVTLIKSTGVTAFTGRDGKVAGAVLDNGDSLEVDVALVGAGIRPVAEIARAAGIETGQNGAVKVNGRMETSVPDIYSAGDCAEAYHRVYGRNVYMPQGTTSNKQGRVAGENMAGGNVTFPGIVGTAVFKVFTQEVGRTGLTEKDAQREGIACTTNTIEQFSKAHYFPGAGKIRVKLVADSQTGKLLGAQLVGREGVTPRIDVFAAAITAGMSLRDIAGLDLGYAPPLAPVYDPVLIAASELEKKLAE